MFFKRGKSILFLDKEISYNQFSVRDKEKSLDKIKELIYKRRYKRRMK